MKPKSVNVIKKKTIEHMKKMNTYRPEFDTLIQTYAETVNIYQNALQQLNQPETMQFTFGGKKNPLLTAITECRRDITALSNQLMLTPRTNETIVEEQKRSDPVENSIDAIDQELEKDFRKRVMA